MSLQVYDLAVIGGGINGAGIAADAAGRGLSVVLLEMGDLGGATSSASSKLIHGGLRYLEHFEFRLVREALAEREILLANAPHIIWPLRFILPHVSGMRPRALLRLGLELYDRLAPRESIPRSEALELLRDPAGAALDGRLRHGFAYWDCWVDDARLVVLAALQAAANGAVIETRTRVTAAQIADGGWNIAATGPRGDRTYRARALVNAAGPWAGQLGSMIGHAATGATPPAIRLVKGSHIVVPRIAGAEDAYLLQSGDGRVVFALPFEERFTLIGTTDLPFEGDPATVTVSSDEEDYLIGLAARFFRIPLTRSSIVWRFAGVRPLQDDGRGNPSAVSRDYRLVLDASPGGPPLLTVTGGKITTYRRLAEAALGLLAPHFPDAGPAWTATAPLPGGDAGPRGMDGYRLDLMRRRPEFSAAMLSRYVRRYGTRADDVVGDARAMTDMGAPLGGGLTAREAFYLRDNEWASTPGDVIWRRTKAGLHMSRYERDAASDWLAANL